MPDERGSDRLYEEAGTVRESWAAEERGEALDAIRAQLASLRLLAAALALYDSMGLDVPGHVARRSERLMPTLRRALDAEACARISEEGRQLSLQQAVDMALAESG